MSIFISSIDLANQLDFVMSISVARVFCGRCRHYSLPAAHAQFYISTRQFFPDYKHYQRQSTATQNKHEDEQPVCAILFVNVLLIVRIVHS